MSTITFDTLQYVKTLKSAGFDDKQAEALAQAQATAIDSASDVRLATKDDIRKIENELGLHRFMLSIVLAGIGAIIMKLFFMH